LKEYQGIQKDQGVGGQTITILENGKTRPLRLKPSLGVYNHSPNGFNWGYEGSGPAQTALAILLDVTGDENIAVIFHQQFKREFVARWGAYWVITEGEIETWLSKQSVKTYSAYRLMYAVTLL